MPLPSPIQHRLLEHHPRATIRLPEIVVAPVVLTFEEVYENDPEEDPAPDNYPILVLK